MARENNGQFKKGSSGFSGKHTKDTKNKISIKLRGRKLSTATILKMSVSRMGEKNPRWKGGKPKCCDCENILSNYNNIRCRKCNDKFVSGVNSPMWIEDRSLIKKQEERNNPNDKQWKYNVYKRDDFKCRISDGNCKGRLEAHHILPWRDYPELRYEINNGITLCHFHHPRKRVDEANLSPYFQKLVAELK